MAIAASEALVPPGARGCRATGALLQAGRPHRPIDLLLRRILKLELCKRGRHLSLILRLLHRWEEQVLSTM